MKKEILSIEKEDYDNLTENTTRLMEDNKKTRNIIRKYRDFVLELAQKSEDKQIFGEVFRFLRNDIPYNCTTDVLLSQLMIASKIWCSKQD